MSERSLKAAIRVAVSEPGTVLFNNPVGVGWVGQVQHLADGSVLIRRPRRVTFGLHEGSGDLVGWRSVVITPDMVGKRVAVFVSVEVKTENGRATAEQRHWCDVVREAGGRAGFARSVVDAVKILGGE